MKKSNHKLFTSFLFSFFLLVIFPFMFILSFLLFKSNSIIRQNDLSANEKLTSQVVSNLTQNMEFAENVAKSVLQNDWVVSFLDKEYQSNTDLSYYRSTIYNYVRISNGISSNMKMNIYLENDTIPMGYGIFYHVSNVINIPAIRQFYMNNDENKKWIDGSAFGNIDTEIEHSHIPTKDCLCLMQKIITGEKKIGLIFISVPKSVFSNFIHNNSLGEKQDYTLIKTPSMLLYNFTNNKLSQQEIQAMDLMGRSNSSDSKYVCTKYENSGYPYKVFVLSPPSSSSSMFFYVIAASFIFCVISVILFIHFNNRTIHDINYCLDEMTHSINNNFTSKLHVSRTDEISAIADRINYLLVRIRELININIKQQTIAKETQLIALQHQINPHFLYNTMDVFASKMEINQLYKESDAMTAFCKILRYNINSDGILATVEDEIIQVQNYIAIQRLRDLEINLNIDIPDDIMKTPIIKFILQPFVENSFKYRKGDIVNIYISAYNKNNFIIFKIQDNGIGISKEQMENLNNTFTSKKESITKSHEKIGLFNINKRLILFYGINHHIKVFIENNLTTFSFSIKKNIVH